MSRRVYVGQPIHADALELLRSHGTVVPGYGPGATSLEDAAPNVEAIMAHWQVIDEPLIRGAPKLRVIARHGVGVDNIDLAAAEARRIPVLIAAHANFRSVAEHVIALLLAVRRQVARGDALVRADKFAERDPTFLGEEVYGTTIGVIGFGRVGSHVAKIARGLCMNVLGYDPFLRADEISRRGGEPIDSLDSLLVSSDAVTVNIPLTPRTRGMLGQQQIGLMRRNAVLIQTSRGGIVDEDALIAAVQRGELAGAGLDVFESEPPRPDSPLLSMDQFVLSPHVGAYTRSAERHMGLYAAQGIVDVWNGVDPDSPDRSWCRAPST